MEQTLQEYISYPAPDGPENWYIHEYPNGRKILVEIDPQTGKAHYIKDL